MNDIKYAVIIDTHPSSDKKKKRLISNLENLKKQNIDVVLTSRYPCDPEIISKADHFIYQSYQKFHFLDSDILNHLNWEKLEPLTPFAITTPVDDYILVDRLVNTQWNISVCSAQQSSLHFLWSKGYNFAFFLIDDFICPDNLSIHLESILIKTKGYRNWFCLNESGFNKWFSPWFFGITIDNNLIEKLPKEDLSKNEIFQKYYPNCAHEDFIKRIWSNENNFIEKHESLDHIFGSGNWNIDKLSEDYLPYLLHVNTISSLFVKQESSTSKYLFYLNLGPNKNFRKASFHIEFRNTEGVVLKTIDLELKEHFYYVESVDSIILSNDRIFLYKKVIGYGEHQTSFEDTVIIDTSKIDLYAKLRYIYHKSSIE